MGTTHLLIVEDDKDLAKLIALNATDAGFSADIAHSGREGLKKALDGEYALIILDFMLPEMDGLQVCKSLRQKDKHIPILMLTARSDEIDKVLAFELGVDDYLTKPFSVRELFARVKALLRRAADPGDEQSSVVIGELQILPEKRKALLRGEALELTSKEYDLLYLLACNAGKPFSREQLLDRIWDYQTSAYEHTVTSHINRLRSKIEGNPAKPIYLLTVWGVGYRFAEANELKIVEPI